MAEAFNSWPHPASAGGFVGEPLLQKFVVRQVILPSASRSGSVSSSCPDFSRQSSAFSSVEMSIGFGVPRGRLVVGLAVADRPSVRRSAQLPQCCTHCGEAGVGFVPEDHVPGSANFDVFGGGIGLGGLLRASGGDDGAFGSVDENRGGGHVGPVGEEVLSLEASVSGGDRSPGAGGQPAGAQFLFPAGPSGPGLRHLVGGCAAAGLVELAEERFECRGVGSLPGPLIGGSTTTVPRSS